MFNLGRFYFSKKELFLLLSALMLGLIVYLKYSISFFDPLKLLILTIFTFLAKGFISTINDTPLLLVFLISIFLTLLSLFGTTNIL